MKLQLLTIFSLLMLFSCSNNNQNENVVWVSGFKVTCDAGAGKGNCLLVNRSDDFSGGNWELFYSNIEGFQFQEGSLKKIKILEQKLDGHAADQSEKKYLLMKEIEQREDIRTLLSGEWELMSLEGNSVNQKVSLPTLGFDLVEMRIYGNGGCNSYNGNIEQLGLKTILLGDLVNTLKICSEDTIESVYLNALSKVTEYQVDNNYLNLYDKLGNTLLTFTKLNKTRNSIRIHDIWTVVRIEGYPINRMVTVPRLEVNPKEMKIYGNDGCNNYFGTITNLTDSSIDFRNIGSTRKLCENMEIPERFNKALTSVKSYKFDQRLLILLDTRDKEVLAFIKGD